MTKTVLVTGAGTGIGRETVSYLATHGLEPIAGLYPDPFEPAAPGGSVTPAGVTTLELDITDPASIARAIARLEARGGRLDGLVNNAGVSLPGPLELVSHAHLRRQFEVNVLGTLAVTRACLPLLRRSGGRVVNLGSVQGRLVLPYSGPYCASKAAIAALTDALRQELAPQGVKVCLIEPGYVRSQMVWKSLAAWDGVAEGVPPEALAPYAPGIAQARRLAHRLGHLGSPPQVVARAIHHALCARWPRRHYRPGRGALSESLLAALLPPALLDALIRALFTGLGRE